MVVVAVIRAVVVAIVPAVSNVIDLSSITFGARIKVGEHHLLPHSVCKRRACITCITISTISVQTFVGHSLPDKCSPICHNDPVDAKPVGNSTSVQLVVLDPLIDRFCNDIIRTIA